MEEAAVLVIDAGGSYKYNCIPAVTHVDGTARIQTVSKKIMISFIICLKKVKN